MVVTDDGAWQISLGRFLQPLYIQIRPSINAPWLSGILCIAYITLTTYLIISVFWITRRSHIALLCGLMIANPTITCLNATYLPWVDVFSLSILFATLAFYFSTTGLAGIFIGATCLVFSMGLYQSYITVYIVLVMIYAVVQIEYEAELKLIVQFILRALALTIIAAIVYYITSHVTCRIFGISMSRGYNGIANVFDFSQFSVISLVIAMYKDFFNRYFSTNSGMSLICVISNFVLLVLVIYDCIIVFEKYRHSRLKKLLLVFVLLVFPFAANVVYFVSKGFAYENMQYALYILYIICLLPKNITQKRSIVTCLCLFIVLTNNVFFANQVYAKKKLMYDSTVSLTTRILYTVENTDGYIPGITPVILIGTLEDNSYCQNYNDGFEECEKMTLVSPDVAVTYGSTYSPWFKYILNSQVNLVYSSDTDMSQAEAVNRMPSFPSKGYCKMFDDVLIVKLS